MNRLNTAIGSYTSDEKKGIRETAKTGARRMNVTNLYNINTAPAGHTEGCLPSPRSMAGTSRSLVRRELIIARSRSSGLGGLIIQDVVEQR